MSFETLAKLFIKMIGERYPSPDKVLRFARLLGIDKDLLAQIIIFTQYRDAMRGVAPRLFQSEKHRQDMLMVLIETLSDLDDQVAEEEEKEKNKQDKEKDEPDQEKHA